MNKHCCFVWGAHGEHFCEGDCEIEPGLWLHGCDCGDDIYEDKRSEND